MTCNIKYFLSFLDKARDIFMCNPRMASALEKNSSLPQTQYTTPAAASIPALTSALKGIPKSLLEKVTSYFIVSVISKVIVLI